MKVYVVAEYDRQSDEPMTVWGEVFSSVEAAKDAVKKQLDEAYADDPELAQFGNPEWERDQLGSTIRFVWERQQYMESYVEIKEASVL